MFSGDAYLRRHRGDLERHAAAGLPVTPDVLECRGRFVVFVLWNQLGVEVLGVHRGESGGVHALRLGVAPEGQRDRADVAAGRVHAQRGERQVEGQRAGAELRLHIEVELALLRRGERHQQPVFHRIETPRADRPLAHIAHRQAGGHVEHELGHASLHRANGHAGEAVHHARTGDVELGGLREELRRLRREVAALGLQPDRRHALRREHEGGAAAGVTKIRSRQHLHGRRRGELPASLVEGDGHALGRGGTGRQRDLAGALRHGQLEAHVGREYTGAFGRHEIGSLAVVLGLADAQAVALELGQHRRRPQEQEAVARPAADREVQLGEEPVVADRPCLHCGLRGFFNNLERADWGHCDSRNLLQRLCSRRLAREPEPKRADDRQQRQNRGWAGARAGIGLGLLLRFFLRLLARFALAVPARGTGHEEQRPNRHRGRGVEEHRATVLREQAGRGERDAGDQRDREAAALRDRGDDCAHHDRSDAPPRDQRRPRAHVGHGDRHALLGRHHRGGVGEVMQVHAACDRRSGGDEQHRNGYVDEKRQTQQLPARRRGAQNQRADGGEPEQQCGGESAAQIDPLEARLGERGADQLGVAAARRELATGVGAECPLIDDAGRDRARSDELHRRAVADRGLAEAQGDGHRLVRVEPRGERNQRLAAVGAGVDDLVVHAGLPELRALGQHEPQGLAAAGLHVELGVGRHLAITRDLAGELREIDHLVHRLAGGVPLDSDLQREGPRGVLVDRERRGAGEQAELGGQLQRLQFQETALGLADLVFHLRRAHDLQETALGLHVQRAHLAGLDRAAAGAHRLFEGEQQRGRAEHGLVERDDHLVALASPIPPYVLAGHVDVARFGRHGEAPLSGRCADDEIVQQHAAVDHAFLHRVEVEHIRLHALTERLDLQRDGPVRLAQPPRLLEAGGLLREIAQRHLDEALDCRRHEAVAGRRHGSDMTAH